MERWTVWAGAGVVAVVAAVGIVAPEGQAPQDRPGTSSAPPEVRLDERTGVIHFPPVAIRGNPRGPGSAGHEVASLGW